MQIRRIPDPNQPAQPYQQAQQQPEPVEPSEPDISQNEIEELRELQELRRIKKLLDATRPDAKPFLKAVGKHSVELPAPKAVQQPQVLPDTGLPENYEEFLEPEETETTIDYNPQQRKPLPPPPQKKVAIPVKHVQPRKPIQQPAPRPVQESIELPEPEPAETTYRPFLLAVLGMVGGIALLAFGIFNAGGFYETGSRLSGDLARFFYVFQIANILEIVGILVILTYSRKAVTIVRENRKKARQDNY